MGAGASSHGHNLTPSELLGDSSPSWEAEVNQMIASVDRNLSENTIEESVSSGSGSNPLEKVMLNAGLPPNVCKRSCQVLDERSIRSIPAFETELVEQRDFLWIDMGITRRDMEAIINECNKIKRFGSNMDAAIAAGMVQDHDAVAEDSDDEDAQILENLSHTNAAANAMGLVGPGSSSSSSSGGRNTALSRLEDELATVESNVDSINSRILELNTSVASNASSQKRMLSELLSQQLTMENQMRERIRLQQERAGVQMSEAAKRARARAVETRVEMLEMLNAAMETSQIMMSTGAALAADQVARSAPSAVRAASDAAELAARQAVHTTLRNFDSIREGVQAGASRLVGGGGGSASSSSREEEKDVKIVSRWNLDLSSPFLEYSPDAGAALNRAGIDPSQLIPDGGAGTGNSAASMLVLSSVFSMGDQASACVEVEFLPPPSQLPGNPGGTTPVGYCHFSFGAALLDAMPPHGAHCLGKEPFTWGIHSTGAGCNLSADGRECAEGHVMGICSCGIPQGSGSGSGTGAGAGAEGKEEEGETALVLRQGDTLSAVLDLDPDSLLELCNVDTTDSSTSSGSNQGDRRGNLHITHNGRLVHTFKGMALDGRYVLGASLKGEACVRLRGRRMARGISIPGSSSSRSSSRSRPSATPAPDSSAVEEAGAGAIPEPNPYHHPHSESEGEGEGKSEIEEAGGVGGTSVGGDGVFDRSLLTVDARGAIVMRRGTSSGSGSGSGSGSMPIPGTEDDNYSEVSSLLQSMHDAARVGGDGHGHGDGDGDGGSGSGPPGRVVHALDPPPGSSTASLWDAQSLNLAGNGAASLRSNVTTGTATSGPVSGSSGIRFDYDTDTGLPMRGGIDRLATEAEAEAEGEGAHATHVREWSRARDYAGLAREARERERLRQEEGRTAFSRAQIQASGTGAGANLQLINPGVLAPGRSMFGVNVTQPLSLLSGGPGTQTQWGNQSPQLSRPASPPRPSISAARRGMLLLSEQQMALQQRMTNNAYYAHALEQMQAAQEAGHKEREAQVLAQVEAASFRERERMRGGAHTIVPVSPIRSTPTPAPALRDVNGEGKYDEGEGEGEGVNAARRVGQAPAAAEAAEKGAADAQSSSSSSSSNGQAQESQDCCVCLAERKSVVLLPCRHMCVCEACGLDDESLLDKCPMCRTNITHRFRVFT